MPKSALEAFARIKGFDERLQGLTDRHDVYPAVDPRDVFRDKTFAGKVVLITGASRGIGSVIAEYYGRAGAKLALVARTAHKLDALKARVLQETTDSEVLTFALDVTYTEAAAKAVEATVERFGRIDIVVANAGVGLPHDGTPIGERDVKQWWNTMEVNLLGTLNFVGPALRYLKETGGYVVALSSIGAQLRNVGSSDSEYKSVQSFAVNPGAIWTDLNKDSGDWKDIFIDTPELASATILALTSGKYDWTQKLHRCNHGPQ